MNEHKKDADGQKKAQDGRDLRNEGRIEDGRAPKTTKPGTDHPERGVGIRRRTVIRRNAEAVIVTLN